MHALDFAAGLGVIRSRVLDLDPKAFELKFEGDLVATGAAAENSGVVAQEGGGQAVRIRG